MNLLEADQIVSANDHAVTNYENLAISGSEPGEWAPGGALYATTTRPMEEEDPDYVLMTVGANPLLSEMLFACRASIASWSRTPTRRST